MRSIEKRDTGQNVSAFAAPPSIPPPISAQLRTAMCLDDRKLYIVLCGSLPALMANLMFMENIQLYHVHIFFSPSDDHECTVMFTPDPFIGDNKRLNEIYDAIGKLLVHKRQQVKKVIEFIQGKPETTYRENRRYI